MTNYKKITASEYWNELLPKCIISQNIIPKDYYYLITDNKTLQKYINDDIIKEFLSDKTNLKILIEEIMWTKCINTKYITQSCDTNDIENIIKLVYDVKYINDDYVLIKDLMSNKSNTSK